MERIQKHGEIVNAEDFVSTYGKTEDNKVDKQAYFDVVTCVTQYLNAINIKNDAYYTYDEKGNYVLAIDEIKIKENIYNLLSQNYITQNQVTMQNVYEKVETLENQVLFVPIEIAMVQDSSKKFCHFRIIRITTKLSGCWKKDNDSQY